MSDSQVYLLGVDPATLTPHHDRQARVALLLTEPEALAALSGRLLHPRRCILLRLRDTGRARELVRRVDVLMAEIARLLGDDYTPLPLPAAHHPLRHPLTWWTLQWTIGLWNLASLLCALRDAHHLAAVGSALALLACACWRVPSYQLAKQGKWE